VRGEDGRGPKSQLYPALCRALGVARLDELLDRLSPDAAQRLSPGVLAPVLFEVAAAGDLAAREVLRVAGHDLGVAARLVAQRLFEPSDVFPLVLGGTLLTKGACDAMREALVCEVRSAFARVRPALLEVDPAVGAGRLALDLLARAQR
jgi:N-acetylglucosamine kinase-like BadF-type ATPase